MRWTSWAKEAVWDRGLIGHFVKSTGAYTFKTMAHFFEQVGVLPKVAYSLMTHKPANKISHQMVYITLHDLLPMILVNTVNTTVQQAFSTADKEEEEQWLSTTTLLSSSLLLLQFAVNAYNFRQGIQMTTRTMLVALSAPEAFNQINPRQKSPLCIEDKCTTAQRIKSGGEELVKLMANDMAVLAISQVPYITLLSKIISIYVRGRYILVSTTPERCATHRGIESENAFALGLGHEGLMTLIRHLLSSTLGLPPALCLNTMEKMLLVFQMAVAAHLTPPLVESGKGTLSIDPLETYERMTGWITKVIAHGLIKEVPRLFEGPGTDIPWNKIVKYFREINNNALTKQIKTLALPSLLHSDQNFVKDPVIQKLWSPLQKQFDTCLMVVLNAGKNERVLLTLLTWAPGTTSLALKLTFGIPQKLTRALVLVAGDENFRHLLQDIQNWIQSLGTNTVQLVNLPRPAVYLKHSDNSLQTPVASTKEEKTETSPAMLGIASGKSSIDPQLLLSRAKQPTADLGFFATEDKKKSDARTASANQQPSIDDLLSF